MNPPVDLRLRLVCALVAIACISQLTSLAIALGVIAVVFLALLSGGPDPALWRRLLHLEGFLLLLFLTLPFTVPGTPLVSLGPLTASVEGTHRAALIAAKVSASVLLFTGLLGAVEASRIGTALRSLHVPERLTRLFVMTMRYSGLLRDEARRLHDAMRARGFQPRSNRHTWRSYGHFAGMLLVRALDRAQRIEEAMRCRGDTGRFPYRALSPPALSDWARSGAIIGAAILALLADRV